jgi:hypothetical protein
MNVCRHIIFITSILIISFALCLLASADSVDMNGDEAIYEAPQVIVPPKIDGVLDDIIWEHAPSVTFGLLNDGGIVDEEYFSTAWAVYDSKKIYVAFKNFDPNPNKITCVSKGRDSNTWSDDECELFIEPANAGSEPYFQFCINAEGEIYDQEKGGQGLAWDADSFQCAAKVYDDHWVLEECFAFEDLDIKEPPIGETWGWNFNRHIVSGVDFWIGWSETGASFHTPSNFGDLVFSSEKLAVNSINKIPDIWGRIKEQ